MKIYLQTPLQFHTGGDGIGLCVANAVALKRLDRATAAAVFVAPRPPLTGHLLEDTIALGRVALLAHIGQLLRNPLKIIAQSSGLTRIRVCGALDYVIDHALQRVWAESAPLTRAERAAKQCSPWPHPDSQPFENVDLLNPLCKPAWLAYIAGRPGWFGYASSSHHHAQQPLFAAHDEMAQALGQMLDTAWRQVRRDPAVVALQHQLATTLTLHIGPGLVGLAMRARMDTGKSVLDARHLNLVWRHRASFETLAQENPGLLPALTAWFNHDKRNDLAQWCDALPEMRRDLLASGLPPRAWRCLAQHGIKRLLPTQLTRPPWESLLLTLQALHAARWPALPPRGFLRLLHDAAGTLDSFEHAQSGVPGWFWQMACDEAAARKGHARAYQELFNCIAPCAWLVREFGLQPDKNQRRKGMAWMCEVTAALERQAPLDDAPAWALWLQSAPWDAVTRLDVVPLLSPRALRQEAMALHNCADGYTSRCPPVSD